LWFALLHLPRVWFCVASLVVSFLFASVCLFGGTFICLFTLCYNNSVAGFFVCFVGLFGYLVFVVCFVSYWFYLLLNVLAAWYCGLFVCTFALLLFSDCMLWMRCGFVVLL